MDVLHGSGVCQDAEADRKPARTRRTASVVRNRLLVGLSFSTGAVDVICYLALGKVFAAFMTGNVVFLGLAAVSSLDSGGSLGPDVGRVVVAMLGFAAGVLFSAKLVMPLKNGAVEVWPRRVSIALAVVAAAEAAFLILWLAIAGHPSTVVGDVLIGILAVAMGIQMDAVRSLRVPEISTTAATATIVSFVNQLANRSDSADRWLYARIMAAMVVGAVAGGVVLLFAPLYAPIIPVVVTIAVIAFATAALKPAAR
ncbi:DUF1275 domain-containing protein [Saccharopolyspora sp. K220]|uniref:YoaK family protein n=1 Tax=Saccharopolyspora soli TaxID=2926618 RepID=UPI001F59D01A|nr:YoaK family protein [Saccharopolyspora soli]MCI2415917.1 DUF1275 domain-containing protein [Saccharopolyspora soli]